MQANKAFEIGTLNAWIFMVLFLLANFILIRLMIKKDIAGGPARVAYNAWIMRFVAISPKVIYFQVIIYSIFLS